MSMTCRNFSLVVIGETIKQTRLHRAWRSSNLALFVATGSATVCLLSGLGSSQSQERHPNNRENSVRYHGSHFFQCSQALCENRENPLGNSNSEGEETESQRFERILNHHRSRINTYRSKWEYKAPDSSSGRCDDSGKDGKVGGKKSSSSLSTSSSTSLSIVTPSRSWPDDIPSNGELSFMLEDLKYCSRSPNFRSDKDYCHRLEFRVAVALLMQFDEGSQKRGFEMLRNLAENGYPDAMAFYGICLIEGRAGTDPHPSQAVTWFRRCANMYEHPQAQYELGVALYTGEGVVENEEEAVRWFELAAKQDHAAACYMLGDCLLDGIGVEMDRGAALEWLVRSSELGHRGARSRVMAVLERKEGEDYGRFTDASRQTMIEHTVLLADKKGNIIARKTTHVKRIGGGSRNPNELARRQTIVKMSRRDTI